MQPAYVTQPLQQREAGNDKAMQDDIPIAGKMKWTVRWLNAHGPLSLGAVTAAVVMVARCHFGRDWLVVVAGYGIMTK